MLTFSGVSVVLMDVEGTTTAIDFVHDTLFPYAAQHLGRYLNDQADVAEVQACMRDVQSLVRQEEDRTVSHEEVPGILQAWIRADRKATPLKTLQGLIWQDGYTRGDFTGHVYGDVKPAFERWRRQGLLLAIYSSGSVAAQQLLFRYSDVGDLTPFLSAHFDTRVGAKGETQSYTDIAGTLAVQPEAVLFLSDMPAELLAARAAGMQVCQLQRSENSPGTPALPADSGIPVSPDFAALTIASPVAACRPH
ncbi:MAG: acireductone synthase [Candidatus Melainabacteria bacterium]